MLRILSVIFVSFLLSACPGGWVNKIQSSYALTPQDRRAEEDLKDSKDYGRPILELGDGVRLQSFIYNDKDVGKKAYAGQFLINLTLGSVKSMEILFDSLYVKIEQGSTLVPIVKKAQMGWHSWSYQHNMEVVTCNELKLETVTGWGILPMMSTAPLPAGLPTKFLNWRDDVLCLRLEFPVTRADMDPERKFQLHFKYRLEGQDRDAVIYYFPFQYGYFWS